LSKDAADEDKGMNRAGISSAVIFNEKSASGTSIRLSLVKKITPAAPC
jgi:hypothetical protein